MTSPPLAQPSLLVEQLTALTSQISDITAQRTTYVAGTVTSNAPTSFGAAIAQPDGSSVTLTGIGASPLFMPAVGTTVTLAQSGPQVVLVPSSVADNSLTPTQLSPDAPTAPIGLSLSSGTVLAADGTTHGTITATWTAPSTTVGGSPIVGALTYVVQSRVTGTTNWTARSAPTTTSVLSGVTPGISFDVRVAAQDRVANLGAFTSVSAITAGQDTTAPSTPGTPTVGSYLGQLKITWNGLLGGAAPPTDFAYLEVHVSATTGFTPSTATLVSQLSAAGSAYATAAYGVTMFAKFVAVDQTGNKSAASAQGSGSTSQVVGADIVNGAVDTAQLANLAVTTAQLAAGAVGTTQLATAAVGTANIANLAVGTAQMANLSVASSKIANLAVGTAQIANLAVNDAQIGSMAVGKVTAGTMSVDVVMGGRFATALTGARVEMNSTGFQKFDSGGNLIVSITGTTTLLQGNFKTAATGRRIEINSAGSTGSIDFYSPSGQDSYVTSYTEPNSPFFESIQMSMNVGGHYLWNSVNIDTIPQIAYHSAWHEFGMTAGGTGFQIGTYTSSASFVTGLVYRLKINSSGIQYGRPDGTVVIDALSTNSDRIRLMCTGVANGSWEVGTAVNSGESLRTYFFQGGGGGGMFKTGASTFQCRDLGDTVLIPIFASAFNTSSDESGKTNIQDLNVDAMAKVRGLRPRTYNRKPGKEQNDNPMPTPPTEIGLLTQEAPPEILAGTVPGDGSQAINLYSYTTLVAAGLQQGLAALDALTARVDALDKKGKP